jgi:hypothetical protein
MPQESALTAAREPTWKGGGGIRGNRKIAYMHGQIIPLGLLRKLIELGSLFTLLNCRSRLINSVDRTYGIHL